MDSEDFPITDAIDIAILMHREAHFGGKFEFMIDYYEKGGKGVMPDFDLERIRQLALWERDIKQNLAALYLSGADAEKVAESRKAYRDMRALYEVKKASSPFPLLIADLILSEDEEPRAEIEAIIAQKSAIVPFLIDLLRSPDFHDPLFPGYGQAPHLAVKCLGEIGDKRAIISLFEEIGEGDFFDEDAILTALKVIGAPAKEFLLRVVKSKPLNIDNEKAAIALVTFRDDPEVAEECFKLLLDPIVRKDQALSTYLILACEGLTKPDLQKQFAALSEDQTIDRTLREDIKVVAKSFDQ